MRSIGQRTFIGQFGDDPSALSYLNARYYDGNRGQFVSQDRIFAAMGYLRAVAERGHNMRKIMEDPQQLHSYSYARNNPIVYKDPEGDLGVLALFAVGAAANVGLQGLEDFASGRPARWENYAGAAVGGVAGTAAFLSSGGNPIATGAITAGTQEYTTQWLGAMSSGDGAGLDYLSVGGETVTGGVFGRVGLPGLKGLTSGRNSTQAITNRIGTQFSNGTIQNFALGTAGKIFTTQLVTGSPQAIITGFSNRNFSSQLSTIRKQLESISRTISALQNKQ